MRKPSSPIKVRSGNIEFHKINAEKTDLRDAYHWTLTLNWRQVAWSSRRFIILGGPASRG